MTATSTLDAHDRGEDAETVRVAVSAGGANLVAQLLKAASPRWNFEVIGPSTQHPTTDGLQPCASTLLDLNRRLAHYAISRHSFEVTQIRQVNGQHVWHSPSTASTAAARTVILSGSGDSFQNVEPALDFLQKSKPRYIIHHMTRPLATGRLWDIIRNGPLISDGVPDPDHLAVIIDADDLRAEGIALRRSLSWEATAEDFVRNLGSNGRLDTLVTCPNLVVRFGNEGVIHHRGRDAVDPTLYFNPRRMEQVNSHMIGMSSAFTAGFAVGFPESEAGVRLGASAANNLAEIGFEEDSSSGAPCYPIESVTDKLTPAKHFSAVKIPSRQISAGDSFSIFNALTGSTSEIARHIVLDGEDKALSRCPIRRFANLVSVERTEQESLGATVDTINERLDDNIKMPTCIELLGPIGSGKKFMATNIAKHVTDRRAVRELSYNARSMQKKELINICHSIRDNTAEGDLTIARFENFECILEPNSPLLPDFIDIMRTGKFTDNGHIRTLGKCLMFFLVSKDSSSLDAVTPNINSYPDMDFKLRNAVDDSALLENMHGVIQLRGPNQAGAQDKMYPVRRAMMLRQLLLDKYPHLSVNGHIKIDDAVLHALLFVPTYKHGLRSLANIITTSRLSSRTKFDISALPPEEQIQLHVDGQTFMSYLRSPKLPLALREKLAEGLFETYKKQRILMANTEDKKKALLTDRSMADWEDLAGELKESTRAQADDIPRKLRAVGCFMLDEERSDPLIPIPEFSVEELDMLSEMEHERFNAERLQRQWRMGPRNSKQKSTPFLVPWRDLTQEWKDVDRVMVECVPRVLRESGYWIYRMKEESE